jgi:hypothetical protein
VAAPPWSPSLPSSCVGEAAEGTAAAGKRPRCSRASARVLCCSEPVAGAGRVWGEQGIPAYLRNPREAQSKPCRAAARSWASSSTGTGPLRTQERRRGLLLVDHSRCTKRAWRPCPLRRRVMLRPPRCSRVGASQAHDACGCWLEMSNSCLFYVLFMS